MKRILSLFVSLLLLTSLTLPAAAVEQPKILVSETHTMENGITITTEIIDETQGRATDKTYTRRDTFDDDGTIIAIIAITATYRYDGTSVSVVSKSVTQADTYEGWSYTQKSFTSSGGTVTLSGKLSKLLIFNSSFTMSMTCDKNGNITY